MTTPGTTAVVSGLNYDLVSLGIGSVYSLPTNWWNLRIDEWDVDPANAALQAAAIADTDPGTPGVQYLNEFSGRMHPDFNNVDPTKRYGIPIYVCNRWTPRRYVDILDLHPVTGSQQSDPGPYPIPDEAITDHSYIENSGRADGDQHMIIIDYDQRIAYELSYVAWNGVNWVAGYGAIFDLKSNNRRPEGWTSSDAAGLCVAAGLIRYDEVYGPNEIEHALRFCLKQNNNFVWPASHDNGIHYPGAPPLGSRIRLKASFDTVNKVGGGTYTAGMQKILRCLKTYGGLMADRGGGFFWQGTMDPRWPWLGPEFHTLHLSDFEFVTLGKTLIAGPTGGNKKTVPSLD